MKYRMKITWSCLIEGKVPEKTDNEDSWTKKNRRTESIDLRETALCRWENDEQCLPGEKRERPCIKINKAREAI